MAGSKKEKYSCTLHESQSVGSKIKETAPVQISVGCDCIESFEYWNNGTKYWIPIMLEYLNNEILEYLEYWRKKSGDCVGECNSTEILAQLNPLKQ